MELGVCVSSRGVVFIGAAQQSVGVPYKLNYRKTVIVALLLFYHVSLK